jgi:hypothetical protein
MSLLGPNQPVSLTVRLGHVSLITLQTLLVDGAVKYLEHTMIGSHAEGFANRQAWGNKGQVDRSWAGSRNLVAERASQQHVRQERPERMLIRSRGLTLGSEHPMPTPKLFPAQLFSELCGCSSSAECPRFRTNQAKQSMSNLHVGARTPPIYR